MAIAVSHAMRQFQPFSSYKEDNDCWPITEELHQMRYPDPWLQGSIRAPSGLLLAPALVLCSCPDYVNGTKRSRKKIPSVCKRCKGTRFPISPSEVNKYGTVRCYPTTMPVPITRPIGGTLRISNTNRPSVLPSNDPYDTLRASRFNLPDNDKNLPTKAKNGTVGKRSKLDGESKKYASARKSLTERRTNLERKSILHDGKSIFTDLHSGFNEKSFLNEDKALFNESKDVYETYEPAGDVYRASDPKYEAVESKYVSEYYEKNNVNSNDKKKYMSVGRRSILECDVNPYELMVANSKNEDEEITMVNGQRIRVQPMQNVANKLMNNSTISENEYEYNNRYYCKSILKKPAATFVDTDTICDEKNKKTFLNTKSGSHFYLSVNNSPRKKVQFLDENNDTNYHTNKSSSLNKDNNPIYNNNNNMNIPIEITNDYHTIEQDQGEEDEYDEIDEEIKDVKIKNREHVMTLKRSNSERQTSKRMDVQFNDTMALRTTNGNTKNMIVRELFNKIDPDKLDGTSPKNQNVLKPARHAPPPPPQSKGNNKLIATKNASNQNLKKNSENERKTVVEKKESLRKSNENADSQKKKSVAVKRNESIGKHVASPNKNGEHSQRKGAETPQRKIDSTRLPKTSVIAQRKTSLVIDAATKLAPAPSKSVDESLKKNTKKESTPKNSNQTFNEPPSQTNQLEIAPEYSASVSNVNKASESSIKPTNGINQTKPTENETIHNKLDLEPILTPPAAPPRKRSNNKPITPFINDVVSRKVSNNSRVIPAFDAYESSGIEITSHASSTHITQGSLNGNTRKISESSSSSTTSFYDGNLQIVSKDSAKIALQIGNGETDVISRNKAIINTVDIGELTNTRSSSYDSTRISLQINNDHNEASSPTSSGYSSYETKSPIDLSYEYGEFTRNNSSDFQDVNSSSNKTILRIVNDDKHKLKIRNEFTIPMTTTTSNEKKTSILINGNDCYSTVNVNDDIPIYQSSVVVNDVNVNQIEIKYNQSSRIYITNDFAPQDNKNKSNEIETVRDIENLSEQSKEIHTKETKPKDIECVNNDDYYTMNIIRRKEEIVSEEQIYEDCNLNFKPSIRQKNNEIMNVSTQFDMIDKDKESNKGKESIRADESIKANKSIKEIAKYPKENNLKPSSDYLKKLLSDPVEAVKMNLVPHVCGKSDVFKETNLINDPLLQNMLTKLELFSLNHDDEINKNDDSDDISSTQYETMDHCSDCYTDNSNRSSITEEELANRTKFYDLLLSDTVPIEVSSDGDDHHYESINKLVDPIYEEIEIPPPLPTNPPPSTLLDDLQLDKELTTRSIFEGASKYDILSYLVDAKERGLVTTEDSYTFNFENVGLIVEETKPNEFYQRMSNMSTVSDSSEDSPLPVITDEKTHNQKSMVVERNDSGVGSETGKYPVAKFRNAELCCEDCEGVNDILPDMDLCRKCSKKRSERKEIIMEIVETEEKYSRDLQIILEEFYQPMHVAGLLTTEQLSCIFINVEELLENSQALAERLRDAVDIAYEQGDEDLLTVNIGKIFLEAVPMLHAFETYCVRQGAASLLLASLEKDKELLRIFLRVSQMENTVLRRMNLNSFLMVPVQRVTKYPLLLNRLYKVTPQHHETRELLKEAQSKIELHLNHMNSETKDVPSKLWRRISNNSVIRRSSAEMDLVNIKLRKIAVDVLEWNHEEAKFALEGKLLFTQPTDNNWRRGRTIKLTPINALLVTNGKASSTKPEPRDNLIFSRHSGVRDAALLLVRDKNGRYSLLREPLYLDRCVIAADPAWQSYFEVQELLGKDTFIFKAEDEDQTRVWYRQLQYYAQGMGTWRKRRNALANIMINSMGLRS